MKDFYKILEDFVKMSLNPLNLLNSFILLLSLTILSVYTWFFFSNFLHLNLTRWEYFHTQLLKFFNLKFEI